MTPATFRFLDLPKELRIMVYERVSLATHRSIVKHQSVTKVDPTNYNSDDGASNPEPSMMVICKTLDVALLATCSQIYHEAMPFLALKLQELQVESVRLVMDYRVFIANYKTGNAATADFPIFMPLLARCRNLAVRKPNPRPVPQPYQIELALTGNNKQVSEEDLNSAFITLWGAAQNFGVSIALFAQGRIRDLVINSPHMTAPVRVPWRQVWNLGRDVILENSYQGEIMTMMEIVELEEEQWTKFWACWEAL
jgi:hypothetical protein